MSAPRIPAVSQACQPRRCFVDLFIAGLLFLFAVDTMPCTPDVVRGVLNPLLNVTGLWQGTWNLFAPIPDSGNHRLRAEIYYSDGSHHVWNSPDWRAQSAWQRFVSHRESEFLENIAMEQNSAAWPGFAHYLQRHENVAKRDPELVVLSVISGEVPKPDDKPWPPAATITMLDHERTFFTLLYP